MKANDIVKYLIGIVIGLVSFFILFSIFNIMNDTGDSFSISDHIDNRINDEYIEEDAWILDNTYYGLSFNNAPIAFDDTSDIIYNGEFFNLLYKYKGSNYKPSMVIFHPACNTYIPSCDYVITETKGDLFNNISYINIVNREDFKYSGNIVALAFITETDEYKKQMNKLVTYRDLIDLGLKGE